MIKFTTIAKDGRTVVGLGLSAENVRRLQAGEPIAVDLREQLKIERGPHVMIFFGETEEAMRRELAPYITSATVIHDQP
ncbi:MAG TPA: hypothetical protein VG276_28240 [Actinomycetes bacterium]|jgi:hypothetical protein|nr:hypothetical protein [Actinomycetes bacterium]